MDRLIITGAELLQRWNLSNTCMMQLIDAGKLRAFLPRQDRSIQNFDLHTLRHVYYNPSLSKLAHQSAGSYHPLFGRRVLGVMPSDVTYLVFPIEDVERYENSAAHEGNKEPPAAKEQKRQGGKVAQGGAVDRAHSKRERRLAAAWKMVRKETSNIFREAGVAEVVITLHDVAHSNRINRIFAAEDMPSEATITKKIRPLNPHPRPGKRKARTPAQEQAAKDILK